MMGSTFGCWKTDELNVFMRVLEKMGVLDELKFLKEFGQWPVEVFSLR